jgi:multicomponent Na+:H+ antiporter subunit D
MIASLPAGLILVAAGLAAPLVPRAARGWLLLAAPVLAFAQLLSLHAGSSVEVQAFGFVLQLVRADKLSLAFGYVFCIAALLNVIFAWHVRHGVEQSAAMVYAGAAVAAVFAGDLLTLFVFWELTAVASVVVVWAQGSKRAYAAGMRYLVIQLGSGMLLAAGAALRYAETGSLAFDFVGLDSPGGALILLAFGIKCAFPLLHNWLQDVYPEASATGTVVLSASPPSSASTPSRAPFPGPRCWSGSAPPWRRSRSSTP